MDKPRLMVVMNGVWGRGAEKCSLYLLQGLQQIGYTDLYAHIFAMNHSPLAMNLYLLPEYTAAAEVTWVREGENDVAALRSLIEAWRPDVVLHPFGTHVPMACQYVNPRPKIVRVVHGFGDNDFDGYMPGLTDMMVAVCKAGVDAAVRRIHSEALVTHIPNGVPAPLTRSEHARAEVRRRFGIPPQAFVWAYVGPMSDLKGIVPFLDALGERANLDEYALVAGMDNPTMDLPVRIANMGLTDRIFLLGHVREICRIYAAADALVIPSEREAMPLTMLEAMAAGLIVVAHKVGGIPEVLEGQEFAVLYDDDLPTALAQASLIPHMAARKAATNLWMDCYSNIIMAGNYDNLFMKLLRNDDGP